MAGGFGKRLMPITKKIPKPLVEIKNVPVIEKILLSLEGCQELSIKADNFFELDSSLPKWLSFIDNRLGSKIFIEDTV